MPHVMPTYARLPVAFTRGEGVWVWDTQGKRYLDCLSGIAVTGIGHNHPRLTRAIAEQAGRMLHASNLYHIPEQEALAAKLCDVSGMDSIFFCNSGCEANEAAIKLARLHGHQRGVETPAIVVMEKAFHGRTMATLSATGSRKVQAGFEPLLSGFVRVPYDDPAALQSIGESNRNVVAVLVEPVQGEGGVNVPDDGYLAHLREVCDRHGWLLMLDEVQTGMARTGKWFAYQHTGMAPDVVTLAKGLGNGLPIGACLARGPAAQIFKAGNHGSTFGGNPLVSVAALTTLQIIDDEGLVAHAGKLGAFVQDHFRSALASQRGVKNIRGRGLMMGIELDRPCGSLVQAGLDAGYLINVTADTVVRLLPPLIMSEAEAVQMVDGVTGLISNFLAQPVAAAAR
jgi:acetylornithine aminotransferase